MMSHDVKNIKDIKNKRPLPKYYELGHLFFSGEN